MSNEAQVYHGEQVVSMIHLRIESRREALDPIDTLSERIIRQVGFSEDECYWLVTAVREAVSNAVVHGNRERPGTHVEVEFQLRTDGIRITVVDEGDGFDPESLPDPVSKERLLDSSGRGVYLMRRFMDEVCYSFPAGGGTAVSMTKSLQPTTPERPGGRSGRVS